MCSQNKFQPNFLENGTLEDVSRENKPPRRASRAGQNDHGKNTVKENGNFQAQKIISCFSEKLNFAISDNDSFYSLTFCFILGS